MTPTDHSDLRRLVEEVQELREQDPPTWAYLPYENLREAGDYEQQRFLALIDAQREVLRRLAATLAEANRFGWGSPGTPGETAACREASEAVLAEAHQLTVRR